MAGEIDQLEQNQNFILQFVEELKNIDKILKRILYDDRYPYYSEIIGGLINSLSGLQLQSSNDKNQILNLCQEILQIVSKNLKTENKVKKDVVFLPYKASMWDSLESIWLAAQKDKEHCNTYVIPIPYADRNPNQSAAVWHNEAELFPKYVPVLDCKKINLKDLHPDVIFIHNPYDNCNSVTSVSMEYYSQTLKEYTDLLVYVPYFVLNEIVNGNEQKEEEISHFVTTLGVVNSDLVIVQSENMRQVYINILMRHTKQQNRNYWEQHILGLGSPKFDKLFLTKKEDLQIPKDWLKIIKNPDGSYKKIFFYNTGLSSFLQYKEKMIDKIKKVFKLFKENQDKAVLLWRPHPLILATLRAMLPNLLPSYKKLLNSYKQKKWGIYDDSADLNRAVILSDFYYGDPSSVIQLYRRLGKPIISQRVEYDFTKYKGTIASLTFKNHFFIDENDIWLISRYTCAMMQFSLSTKKLLQSVPLPEIKYGAFNAIVKSGNYIYFSPGEAEDCWKFDINTKQYEKVDIGLSFTEKNMIGKFSAVISKNDSLYFFGNVIRGIIVYNIKTGEYKRISGYFNELLKKGIERIRLINYYTLHDDKIYLALNKYNYILEFNFKDDTYKIHQIGNDINEHFFAMASYKENLIITNQNGVEIIWNEKQGVLKRQDYISSEYRSNAHFNTKLRYVFVIKNTIIYVLLKDSTIYYRDIDEQKLHKIVLPNEFFSDRFSITYRFAFCLNDELYLQALPLGKMLVFNPVDKSYRVEEFMVEDDELQDIIQMVMDNSKDEEDTYIQTTDTFLDEYINLVDVAQKKTYRKVENAGEKIFKTIMSVK